MLAILSSFAVRSFAEPSNRRLVRAVDPELIVGVPHRVGHRRQQQNPADQPEDVDDHKNAALWLLLGYEIGNIGEAHVIAKSVNNKGRHKMPGSDEQERRVNAEDRCVKELEERDYDRRFLIHARPKPLDHVMEMS